MFENLEDEFEKYDCKCPMPYEDLVDKTLDETALRVREEWVSELEQYETSFLTIFGPKYRFETKIVSMKP